LSRPAPTLDHLALVGTTASGKSALAMEVARRLPGPALEIVSVDSMQVYRGMDVGTAKATPAERAEVAHHLLDLVDPGDAFSVSAFAAQARAVLAAIEARGHRALLVGGTGLYLRAAIGDLDPPGRWPDVARALAADPDTEALHRRLVRLDPVAAARIEPGNRRRIIRALEVVEGSGRPFSSFGPGMDVYPPTRFCLAGVWLPRAVVARRIRDRFGAMVEHGLLDEARRLVAAGSGPSSTARQALGYREVLRHIEQGEPLDACLDDAVARTRAFARRQRVWFRRDPRIRWYATSENPFAVLPALLGDWS
jgi:tRNA dimethylallyltransferase